MCGLAGATGTGAEAVARRLNGRITHRGPDGEAVWCADGVALGHTRLAIMDPTARSGQPFELGPITLTYNGEIYNHVEIRRELEADGHGFTTTGDTEIVARILLEHGVAGLARLDGMYAIAVWDRRDRSLTLARDRHGIKPLYWRPRSGGIEWCSELEPLRRDDDLIDAAAMREFLRFGAPITTPFVHDVAELAPGSWLRLDGRGMTTGAIPTAPTSAPADPIEALHLSITQHSRADRPVALFLSGGFDSAVVLRGLRDAGADPLCLTLATSENGEEVDRARAAARHYGARHEVVHVDETTIGARAVQFLEAIDQPGIDGFNTSLISEICRAHDHPVALSGLGGDEVLGGYRYYATERRARQLAPVLGRIPGSVRTRLATAVATATGTDRARVDAVFASTSTAARHRGYRTLFTDTEVVALTRGATGRSLRWDVDHQDDARRQLAALDASTYLRPTLLRDADVHSMAHGVELRVPFVDRRVIDSVLAAGSAPTKLDIAHAWNDDFLVQKATEQKLTFRLPWRRWLLDSGDLTRRTLERPTEPWLGLLDTDAATRLVRADDPTTDPLRRWALIVLSHWLHRSPQTARIETTTREAALR